MRSPTTAHTKNTLSFFQVCASKVRAKEQLRSDFYSDFKPYQESEHAEEFLPFFLQRFVRSVYHVKVESLRSWLAGFPDSKDLDLLYKSRLLDMMWISLPSSVVDNFVNGDFRITLDNYVALAAKPFLYQKKIPILKDEDLYSRSLAEPKQIIHFKC